MTIAGELEFGFFCGNFSQNQNLIWNDPVESHQMGISHFFTEYLRTVTQPVCDEKG